MLTILAKVFVLTDYQEHSCLSVSGIYCLVLLPLFFHLLFIFVSRAARGKREEGRGRGAWVIMTCQIRSDGTCSECKHNSECSDDIFQAVFLLGKISRVTAQPESHGSQLHNEERRHTHTHTHTQRQRVKK